MAKRKLYIALVCLLALALLAAVAFGTYYLAGALSNEYSLRVTLNGRREIVVPYGDTYKELGAQAEFSGTHFSKEPVDVEVTVENKVDSEKLGIYVLKYTATYKGYVGTAYRKVSVLDEVAPEITLVADPDKYTLPTKTYKEEGFTATDNHDGDITDRVKREVTRKNITYTVTDSSGNKTEVVREIFYDDPIAPVIKLKGKSVVTIKQGEEYKEPGFTAKDNCDGNLTKRVRVTGRVDVDTPGDYTIQYSVRDSYDNLAAVCRTVRVKGKSSSSGSVQKPTVVVPNGKVIYLTFDDGPGPRTPELLKVLKKYNVKATFFVMNTDYVSTIKQIVKDGHSIGVHTATHNYRQIYASESAYFKDLEKMKGIIKKLTGIETTLIRFPGGSSNTVSSFNRGIMTRLTKRVVQEGYQYFDWNVDSNDAGGAYTSRQVYNNVISGVKNRKVSIVLQHDIKGFSIDAVEDIILWGLKNGYTFLPLDSTSPGAHHGINN